jgi:RimJ/RimL family protein N-acetyltransferase
VLETARLHLRPLELADEDDVLVYQSDPEIVRYIPWPERTREQVRAGIVAFKDRTRMERSGDALVLAMVEKRSGTVIGQMNVGITSREDAQGEFGYVVARAFGRRGFATEASAAVLDYAFDVLDLHRVTAQIDTRNVASVGVVTKLGLRREAEFRENEWFKGEWTSSWIYAILAAEWRAARDSMVTDERT